jgi:hypothetical protein
VSQVSGHNGDARYELICGQGRLEPIWRWDKRRFRPSSWMARKKTCC